MIEFEYVHPIEEISVGPGGKIYSDDVIDTCIANFKRRVDLGMAYGESKTDVESSYRTLPYENIDIHHALIKVVSIEKRDDGFIHLKVRQTDFSKSTTKFLKSKRFLLIPRMLKAENLPFIITYDIE